MNLGLRESLDKMALSQFLRGKSHTNYYVSSLNFFPIEVYGECYGQNTYRSGPAAKFVGSFCCGHMMHKWTSCSLKSRDPYLVVSARVSRLLAPVFMLQCTHRHILKLLRFGCLLRCIAPCRGVWTDNIGHSCQHGR
jgi:hypothetical protein